MQSPDPNLFGNAPVTELRSLMSRIVNEPGAASYRIPMASPVAASRLRSRMNKIRTTDRKQNYSVYAEANKHRINNGQPAEVIPGDAAASIYDCLVFGLEGSTLIISKSLVTANDLLRAAGADHLVIAQEPAFVGEINPADYGIDESRYAPQAPSVAPKPSVGKPTTNDSPTYKGDYDTAPGLNDEVF